jgi:plastocyanin
MSKTSSESSVDSSVDRRTFVAFLGGAAVFLVGCSSDPTGGGGNGGDDGGGDGGGGGGEPNADVVVEMENIAFNAPGGGDDVTIQLGQTVGWVNRDNVQHTATSSQEPDGGNEFDSDLLSNGETFIFEPNVTGTWVYFCEVHPNQMVGATIVVQ